MSFAGRTVRPFGLPDFFLPKRAAAELNLAATRLGIQTGCRRLPPLWQEKVGAR